MTRKHKSLTRVDRVPGSKSCTPICLNSVKVHMLYIHREHLINNTLTVLKVVIKKLIPAYITLTDTLDNPYIPATTGKCNASTRTDRVPGSKPWTIKHLNSVWVHIIYSAPNQWHLPDWGFWYPPTYHDRYPGRTGIPGQKRCTHPALQSLGPGEPVPGSKSCGWGVPKPSTLQGGKEGRGRGRGSRARAAGDLSRGVGWACHGAANSSWETLPRGCPPLTALPAPKPPRSR